MKKYVIGLLCALILLGTAGCTLLLLLGTLTSTFSFHAIMTMSDLSQPLTIDAADTEGTREYEWGLRIDSDANAATGDPGGYDVEIVIYHDTATFFTPSEWTLTDGLADSNETLADQFTPAYYSWNGSSWELYTVPETLMGNVSCMAKGNSIHFVFSLLDSAPPVAAGYRTEFYTLFYPPPTGPAAPDTTATVVVGNGSMVDAAGDAGGYPFIDLLSAEIKYIP